MDRLIDDSLLAGLGSEPAPRAAPDFRVPELDQHVAATQEEFIAETLRWCVEMFGAKRVRFIRPLETVEWRVYARQGESTTAHPADYAEVAMAYTIGLGRESLLATRPRISRADGSGLRPIAITSYLGIPIVVQDRLVGVIEIAGEMRPDMETALYMALPRLINAGERMLFDPRLTLRPVITRESILVLDAAVWTTGDIMLTPDELAFLAQIKGPTSVMDAAAAAAIDPDRAVAMADELALRGLVSLHDDE